MKTAIIGGGFMGGALAEGLLDSGWGRETLVVAEVRNARRDFLTRHLRVPTVESAVEAVQQAHTVVFAVKPQQIKDTLAQVKTVWAPGKLVISVCAGVTIATFEQMLGDVPVIRTMPNTPAAIGMAVTALARGQFATDKHLADALNILSAVGKVVVVDEAQMDTVTAVSGTGPAYIFYLAEGLIEAATELGLSREQAYTLVYQTIRGAATLLAHDTAGPAELRKRVTSPGGTTHAAITHLEGMDWKQAFKDAVAAAKRRAQELGAG
ncbi:MAG: pyrroline-5-carboxylate reductase [Planctomycetes bacterium]|nr:pyrroline-5-carboxylate reductase [Planctomycetota bacterium]MCW8136254.1 pyrroline-5-carboxylate reductase [Planctomycetota bacterium]